MVLKNLLKQVSQEPHELANYVNTLQTFLMFYTIKLFAELSNYFFIILPL